MNTKMKAHWNDTPEARYCKDRMETAQRHLDAPEVIWPNGRSSHEVSYEIWEQCQDEMLEHIHFTVA